MKKKLRIILRRWFWLRIISLRIRLFNQFLLKNTSKKQLEKRERKKYLKFYSRKPELTPPILYSEKLLWQKLYHYNDEAYKVADKLNLKHIVASKFGEKHTTKTLGEYEKIDDIDFNLLPNTFVIKVNHITGYIYKGVKTEKGIIFKDLKLKGGPQYNLRQVKKIFKLLMKINMYYTHLEWPYKKTKPKIYIEEYLDMEDVKEYNFYFANSKLSFYCISGGKLISNTDTVFDRYSNFLDFFWGGQSVRIHEPPANLDTFINIGTALSIYAVYTRIDFFEINDRIIVGEVTFFDGGGYMKFKGPNNGDEILGKLAE